MLIVTLLTRSATILEYTVKPVYEEMQNEHVTQPVPVYGIAVPVPHSQQIPPTIISYPSTQDQQSSTQAAPPPGYTSYHYPHNSSPQRILPESVIGNSSYTQQSDVYGQYMAAPCFGQVLPHPSPQEQKCATLKIEYLPEGLCADCWASCCCCWVFKQPQPPCKIRYTIEIDGVEMGTLSQGMQWT